MNNGSRDDGGIPRARQTLAALPEENWRGANDAKSDNLRHRTLQRRAGALGIELRHSEYGYALIDSARKRIDERSDMTLDEIESWLARA